MRCKGHPTASFDILLGEGFTKPGKQNAMDLLSDAGFARPGCFIHVLRKAV